MDNECSSAARLGKDVWLPYMVKEKIDAAKQRR